MITVTTRLLASEGRAEELAAVLTELCAETVAQAAGCQRSEVSRSAHQERRFLLLACFDDEAAHAAYANADFHVAALPRLMDCLEGLPDIEVYEEFSALR